MAKTKFTRREPPPLALPSDTPLSFWRAHMSIAEKQYAEGSEAAAQRLAEMREIRAMKGLKGWLTRSFTYTLADHKAAYDKGKAHAHAAHASAYRQTIDTFDPMIMALLKDDPQNRAAFEQYRTYVHQTRTGVRRHKDGMNHIDHTRTKIKTALQESQQAKDWEWLDMIGSNGGLSLISYNETEEAKDAIKAVAASMEKFGKHVEGNQDIYKNKKISGPAGYGDTQQFHVWTDLLFQGLGGFFFSWMNIDKLKNSMEKMKMLQESLGTLRNELSGGYTAAFHTHHNAVTNLNRFRADFIEKHAAKIGLTEKETADIRGILQREAIDERLPRASLEIAHDQVRAAKPARKEPVFNPAMGGAAAAAVVV